MNVIVTESDARPFLIEHVQLFFGFKKAFDEARGWIGALFNGEGRVRIWFPPWGKSVDEVRTKAQVYQN